MKLFKGTLKKLPFFFLSNFAKSYIFCILKALWTKKKQKKKKTKKN